MHNKLLTYLLGTGSAPDDVLRPTAEKSVPDAAVSDTREPTVNGVKNEPNVSCDGVLQTGSGESSRGGAGPEGRDSGRDPKPNRADDAKKPWKKPKSLFRRPLDGELGRRLYTMPPLPPTATTLGGFKSLLLDRLRLLRIAGKFHVDSVLGIPEELRHELDSEAPGAAVKPEQGTTRDAARTAEANGNPSTSSALDGSEAPSTEAALRRRRRAEREFTVSYPQMIRSELHAEHWMKAIRNTHDYQMLRSRFLSLFLWPALLSSVRVDDQEFDAGTAPVASLLGSGQLVVEPSDIEEEEEEKINPRVISVEKIRQYR